MNKDGSNTAAKPFLNWHYRMGKHEAVHENFGNRLIHWICIPCQIFSTFLVFSNIELMAAKGSSIPLNLSLLVLLCLVALYWRLNFLGAMLTTLSWAPLLYLANFVHYNSLFGAYEICFGFLFFVVTLSIQIGVGHNIYEEGRDDTEQNIGELIRTFNPVYISCIPFYHNMEIIFNFGFEPAIRNAVEAYKRSDD